MRRPLGLLVGAFLTFLALASPASARDSRFIRSYDGIPVPATGAYFGCDDPAGSFTSATGCETLLGRKMGIRSSHFGKTANTPNAVVGRIEDDAAAGTIPMITMAADSYYSGEFAAIAAGQEDAFWNQLFNGIAGTGVPTILRLWQEPNGAHVTAAFGHQADYIAAWRHLHDLWVADGAHGLWVFSPQLHSSGGGDPAKWESYYPGDPYVDWMGLDLYRATFDNAQPFIKFGVAHGKPFIVSESGFQQGSIVTDPLTGKKFDKDGSLTGRSLILNALNGVKSHTNVVAYVVWNNIGPIGNDRIDTSAKSLAQYKHNSDSTAPGECGNPCPPGSTAAGDDKGCTVTPPPGKITHIVQIMEENKTYSAVIGQSTAPYINSLAKTYANATNMHGVSFPSLPNYIALTSGNIPAGVAGVDCLPTASCSSPDPSIFEQAPSWQVWAETMPSNCYHLNSGDYAVRHTAAPYYTRIADACKVNDIPLPANPSITAAYTLVAPNVMDDMHSSTVAAGDTWLKNFLPKLLADPNYTNGSTLIELTWDSGDKATNHIPTIFIHPSLSGVTVSGVYDHYSVLRLNEELLGLPLLGKAASASDPRAELGF